MLTSKADVLTYLFCTLYSTLASSWRRTDWSDSYRLLCFLNPRSTAEATTTTTTGAEILREGRSSTRSPATAAQQPEEGRRRLRAAEGGGRKSATTRDEEDQTSPAAPPPTIFPGAKNDGFSAALLYSL